MKLAHLFLSIIIVSAVIFSCDGGEEKIVFDTQIVDTLIQNEKRYSAYSKVNFNFDDSAIYLNEQDSIISAINFFESVRIRSYFPVKAKNANQFKLVKVSDWPNENIYAWVSGEGFWGVGRERLKGRSLFQRPLPDIYGNIIDSTMLNGKHVFVKFWFIHCVPCVAEMPELNSIVEENKSRKDIAFISFALDKKEDLVKFFKTTTFKYQLLSSYKIPEIDSLKITSFPTHLYLKGNTIQKVVKVKDIRTIIEKIH